MMTKIGSKRNQSPRPNAPSIEICILAGGSSERMGRDKSRLRFGQTTMLGQIRRTARATGLPVRIIRRDCIPKCGPLSGIYTALKTTKSGAILFLACDMPLVSVELIRFILQQAKERRKSRFQTATQHSHSHVAHFIRSRGRAGFPFILSRGGIETVGRQIQLDDYSLQGLAKALQADILPLRRRWSQQLFNVNSSKDWTVVKRRLRRTSHSASKARVSLHLSLN